MHQLFFIAVEDLSGLEIKLPVDDILRVQEGDNKTTILLRSGAALATRTSATAIFTALDALKDDYLSALAGTVP